MSNLFLSNGVHLLSPATPVERPVLGMSDVELESHITSCGELMLAAYARYEASSDLQDRAEADSWRITQEEAIKARRPGWMASMELARGLAG